MNADISFPHVLNELSINRKDPCEVIRELISNSYDAGARNIYYWPLYDDEGNDGFVYFGDGSGLSMEVSEGYDISPYKAFFSIGKTTKRKGDGVGYKCQGSKLCFACKRVTIITKTEDEDQWRFFQLDDPRRNLKLDTDISPGYTIDPYKTIRDSIFNFDQVDTSIAASLQEISSSFFNSGLMVIMQGVDTEDFAKYFDPIKTQNSPPTNNNYKWSYIYNYIRLYTKHADVCQIEGEYGFLETSKEQFRGLAVSEAPSLKLWTESSFEEVPYGYWYLKVPEESDATPPLSVSSLRHARFRERFAVSFSHGRKVYQLIIAIDGKKRALGDKRTETGYFSLGRRGNSYSGIRLTDQRGAFLAAQGVKISSITEDLFQNSMLSERYGVLADASAQEHYTLIINGPFDVVTNRNSPTSSAIKTILSNNFMNVLKNQLDLLYGSSEVFKQLIQRLEGDTQSNKIEKELRKTKQIKESIPLREKFRIEDSGTVLDGKWFACPKPGEENWVGVLYSMISMCLPSDLSDSLKKFWLRPMNFSNVGFDAIAQDVNTNEIAPFDDLKVVEYKLKFSNKNIYNHPLAKTDLIVAWDIEARIPEGGQPRVTDEYGCTGDIEQLESYDFGQAYVVKNIRTASQVAYPNEILVVSLRWLLWETYGNIEYDDHAVG